MNRRAFMKWLGIGAGTVAAAPVLAGYVEPKDLHEAPINGDVLYIDQYREFVSDMLVTTNVSESYSWR